MTRRRTSTYGDEQLQTLQRNTFRYFWQETNPSNGLMPDNTSADGMPANIAGVGLALSSYPVAVERSVVARAQAVERTLATWRVFWNTPQGLTPDATGCRGFFCHFLDVTTGRRAWRSELSMRGPGFSDRYDGESAAVVITRRAYSRGLRPLRAR
jgi:hypothetical protein